MLKELIPYHNFYKMASLCDSVHECQTNIFAKWYRRDHRGNAYSYNDFLGECYMALLETLNEEKESK